MPETAIDNSVIIDLDKNLVHQLSKVAWPINYGNVKLTIKGGQIKIVSIEKIYHVD